MEFCASQSLTLTLTLTLLQLFQSKNVDRRDGVGIGRKSRRRKGLDEEIRNMSSPTWDNATSAFKFSPEQWPLKNPWLAGGPTWHLILRKVPNCHTISNQGKWGTVGKVSTSTSMRWQYNFVPGSFMTVSAVMKPCHVSWWTPFCLKLLANLWQL